MIYDKCFTIYAEKTFTRLPFSIECSALHDVTIKHAIIDFEGLRNLIRKLLLYDCSIRNVQVMQEEIY